MMFRAFFLASIMVAVMMASTVSAGSTPTNPGFALQALPQVNCPLFGYDPTSTTAVPPSEWGRLCTPLCGNGVRQSPVNLTNAKWDFLLAPLFTFYSYKSNLVAFNSGHSFQINFPTVDPYPLLLQGGPFPYGATYQLAQLHFHWAPTSNEGSEHLNNGVAYSAEIHLVHFNTKYGTFTNATNFPESLVVVGVFAKVVSQNLLNDWLYYSSISEMDKLTKYTTNVQNASSTAPITTSINVNNLLPADRSYYTYLGSLTTPGCAEIVTWVVLNQPVYIYERHVQKLRSILDDENVALKRNNRPVQPIGTRTIRKNFW